jgi:hypothetical protein
MIADSAVGQAHGHGFHGGLADHRGRYTSAPGGNRNLIALESTVEAALAMRIFATRLSTQSVHTGVRSPDTTVGAIVSGDASTVVIQTTRSVHASAHKVEREYFACRTGGASTCSARLVMVTEVDATLRLAPWPHAVVVTRSTATLAVVATNLSR